MTAVSRREFTVSRAPGVISTGRAMKVVLRPDALDLVAPDSNGAWVGDVVTRRFAGGNAVYRVRLGSNVTMEVESTKMDVREGDRIGVVISREPVPVVEDDDS